MKKIVILLTIIIYIEFGDALKFRPGVLEKALKERFLQQFPMLRRSVEPKDLTKNEKTDMKKFTSKMKCIISGGNLPSCKNMIVPNINFGSVYF